MKKKSYRSSQEGRTLNSGDHGMLLFLLYKNPKNYF